MNTFQLSCFLAVAEYLNFSQAAQSLHVTHPAVSQQIQSLEKELGVKLVHRTTRVVRLTEEGKTFLRDAEQMLAISERAKKRFSSSSDGDIETLTIGCYNYPCMMLLRDTLEALKELRPELHPRLQVVPFQHIYRMLEEGDLDVVAGFKESRGMGAKLQYREVIKVPMVCASSCRHPIAGRDKVDPEDIKEEKLVLNSPAKAPVPVVQIQGRLLGTKPASDFYFCESAEAMTVLVAAGYGVSVLPDFLILDSPFIVKRPLENVDPMSFGVYYQSVQGNDALKDFIQCLKENLGRQPN